MHRSGSNVSPLWFYKSIPFFIVIRKMAGHRKSVKKAMEDYIDRGESEVDLQDRGIENLLDVPFLSMCSRHCIKNY